MREHGGAARRLQERELRRAASEEHFRLVDPDMPAT
jgi:hypothetical protein